MVDLRKELGAIDLDSPACLTNIKEFIPTGVPTLDLAIGRGGIPVGRPTSIVGEPGVGKSSLVYSILAQTQKKGGIAVLVDSEVSLETERARTIGLDTDLLFKFEDIQLEDIVPLIEKVINTTHKQNPEQLVCIALDTCSALASESDLSLEPGGSLKPGSHARHFSHVFRRLTMPLAKSKCALILVHQPRTKIITMGFGSPLTWLAKQPTTFHSPVILQVFRMGYFKQGSDVVGIKCKVKVIRNKLAAPLKECQFIIRFDSGLDAITPMLDILTLVGTFVKKGGWYTDPNGVKIQASAFREYYQEYTEQVNLWVQEAMAQSLNLESSDEDDTVGDSD